MTVAELIEELKKMPQDLEVHFQPYDPYIYKVNNVEVVERRGRSWVELDNYPKGNFFAI